jgi:hypothetical protein
MRRGSCGSYCKTIQLSVVVSRHQSRRSLESDAIFDKSTSRPPPPKKALSQSTTRMHCSASQFISFTSTWTLTTSQSHRTCWHSCLCHAELPGDATGETSRNSLIYRHACAFIAFQRHDTTCLVGVYSGHSRRQHGAGGLAAQSFKQEIG